MIHLLAQVAALIWLACAILFGIAFLISIVAHVISTFKNM